LKVLVLAVLVLVAGCTMLLLATRPYMIPTDSMRPTLLTGDYVFVTKTPGTLRFGDIAWFRPPAGPNTHGVFVKRIVGIPGDRIRITAGAVDRNGQRLAEPYALYDPIRHNPSAENTETVVPPNTYYVLGDNRDDSLDSRNFGCVPAENFDGRALFLWSRALRFVPSL
jgi:signal peptidase I, bacterial type